MNCGVTKVTPRFVTHIPGDRIRPEKKFASAEALTEQIRKDHPELPAFEEYADLLAAIEKELN